MTDQERIMMLESELASERAASVGLRAELKRTVNDSFSGFDALCKERDLLALELSAIRAALKPNIPVPNMSLTEE